MRYAPRAILSGLLGFAAAFVVACGGSSGLLSSGQANDLSSRLDSISSAVQQHDCNGASNAVEALASSIQGLPATVDARLRRNLGQGVQTVSALAERECLPTAATTETRPTTTTPTTTTDTTTTPTTTTPTTTTPTTTTPTETPTTPPPTTSPTATTPPPTGTNTTGSGGAGLGGGTTPSGGAAGNGGNGNGGNGQ